MNVNLHKTPNISLKNNSGGARKIAQWYSTCLAYLKPRVQSQHQKQRKKNYVKDRKESVKRP
jgi:hypothetical protein